MVSVSTVSKSVALRSIELILLLYKSMSSLHKMWAATEKLDMKENIKLFPCSAVGLGNPVYS